MHLPIESDEQVTVAGDIPVRNRQFRLNHGSVLNVPALDRP
jgi:hypothetical protein